MMPRRFTLAAARKRRWYVRHCEERKLMHAKGYRYSSGVWVPLRYHARANEAPA